MQKRHLTDGGLETDLIFNRGIDLPEFAAFPLLDSDDGRTALRDYYDAYLDLAVRAEVPILLETPTWRANPDHASSVGYDATALDRINRHSVDFLAGLAAARADELVGWEVGGILGPRGDGYLSAGGVDPDAAAEYHRAQLAAFSAAGATRATVLTITDVGEAIGIAQAAADVGIDLAVGYTVEVDGRLPDGTALAEAIRTVDADTAPVHYLVNCAHPHHIACSLDDDRSHHHHLDLGDDGGSSWRERIGGLRVNASTMSHDELDACEVLDDGDPHQLAVDQQVLLDAFPNVVVLGGCCGTDARHVAAMWDAPAPT